MAKTDKASELADNAEQKSPDEMDTSGAPSEGVDVPELFQQAMHKHLSKASKPMLSHARAKISAREDEMRDEEMAKKGNKGKMSMTDAPSSVGESY